MSITLPAHELFRSPASSKACEILDEDDQPCGMPAEYVSIITCEPGHDETIPTCSDHRDEMLADDGGDLYCDMDGPEHDAWLVAAMPL